MVLLLLGNKPHELGLDTKQNIREYAFVAIDGGQGSH